MVQQSVFSQICKLISDAPRYVPLQINGQPVGTGTVGSDGNFNIPFTAPGVPGTYTVVTSFTPAGGSAPTGGGSASLTVSTTGTDSITSTISPNPGSPGGSETASGTVTTATGSPGGGTVTVTVRLPLCPSFSVSHSKGCSLVHVIVSCPAVELFVTFYGLLCVGPRLRSAQS